MKQILLKKNDLQVLNFEEVLKKHKRWIEIICTKWLNTKFEFEDLVQISTIAMWRAYKDYSYEEKPVAFNYFAKKYIQGELQHCWLYNNRKMRKAFTVSLNQEAPGTNKATYAEVIQDIKNNDITGLIDIKTWFQKLTKSQQIVLKYIIQGYKQTEIANLLNISKSSVNQAIRYARMNRERI